MTPTAALKTLLQATGLDTVQLSRADHSKVLDALETLSRAVPAEAMDKDLPVPELVRADRATPPAST